MAQAPMDISQGITNVAVTDSTWLLSEI